MAARISRIVHRRRTHRASVKAARALTLSCDRRARVNQNVRAVALENKNCADPTSGSLPSNFALP
jgi:hypothetical protein